jgi:hypothetical protein
MLIIGGMYDTGQLNTLNGSSEIWICLDGKMLKPTLPVIGGKWKLYHNTLDTIIIVATTAYSNVLPDTSLRVKSHLPSYHNYSVMKSSRK